MGYETVYLVRLRFFGGGLPERGKTRSDNRLHKDLRNAKIKITMGSKRTSDKKGQEENEQEF